MDEHEADRCDECGSPAGNPHRLRCGRQYDEQEETRAFEESSGAQFALIAGVVVGLLTLYVLPTLAFLMGFHFNFFLYFLSAGGACYSVYTWLLGIAQKRAKRK